MEDMKTDFEKELGQYLYDAFFLNSSGHNDCVPEIKKIVEKYYTLNKEKKI